MLLYEKFLLQHNQNKYNFPLLIDCGVFAYEIISNSKNKIYFITINASNNKNNFIKFSMRQYELNSDGFGVNYMNSKSSDVEYTDYFSSILQIKKDILKNYYYIPKNSEEFFCLLWKSFVVLRDDWFSKSYSRMPVKILDTISDSITALEKKEKINTLLGFLQLNYSNIYSTWIGHTSSINNLPFQSWFAEFVEN